MDRGLEIQILHLGPIVVYRFPIFISVHRKSCQIDLFCGIRCVKLPLFYDDWSRRVRVSHRDTLRDPVVETTVRFFSNCATTASRDSDLLNAVTFAKVARSRAWEGLSPRRALLFAGSSFLTAWLVWLAYHSNPAEGQKGHLIGLGEERGGRGKFAILVDRRSVRPSGWRHRGGRMAVLG